MARSTEPFWWSLFAAGGVIAAFLVPVQILLTGFVAPLGWGRGAFEYERLITLISHPLTKLYLFAVISLPLFHWAHRFRFTLIDLGMKRGQRAVAITCYAAAVVGTVLTAAVLARL